MLREALAAEPRIKAAFIYGSVAKGGETAASNIDLALIGVIQPRDLAVEAHLAARTQQRDDEEA